MRKLKHNLVYSKDTEVWCENKEDMQFDMPHSFTVTSKNGSSVLSEVHFQEGPVEEYGVNGITDEDLIMMVICRLRHLQRTAEHECSENNLAINNLDSTLLWFKKRREKSGVPTTHSK